MSKQHVMTKEVLLPKLATVTSKRQVTIPKRFGQKYGLVPGSKVALDVRNGAIVITPYPSITEDLTGSLSPSTRRPKKVREVTSA
jgi:AbrB family looped-hinge helix DNA binding protein